MPTTLTTGTDWGEFQFEVLLVVLARQRRLIILGQKTLNEQLCADVIHDGSQRATERSGVGKHEGLTMCSRC